MEGVMRTNKIRTIGDYIEAMIDSPRIIIQVNRPGLAIPAGRFFSFSPKNLNENEQLIIDAIRDVEIEALEFQDPILKV